MTGLRTHSEVTKQQASCFRALKWIETRLGRITHALAWHDLHKTISAALASKERDRAALDAGEHEFDGCLGILLLRTGLEDLPSVARLPDTLFELRLPGAATALLFALGHDAEAAEALSLKEGDPENVTGFFKRLNEPRKGRGCMTRFRSSATVRATRDCGIKKHSRQF